MEGELYLFGPELDRSPQVKWYGVTEISLLYAVAARTPEEALSQLNEYHNEVTGYDLMMPMITEYPDDTRQQLREKYGERMVVMLIPFSTVEYPTDLNNLTEEQQAAFDRLK